MSRCIHGYYFEDLEPDIRFEFAKTVTEADVVGISGISGDLNPIHGNKKFAKTTMFISRIVHGMLRFAFLSTVLDTKLPESGCVYVSQNLKFKAAVRLGDTGTARVGVIFTLFELFGDVATQRLIRHGDDEGLFASYDKVEFLAPVFPGDYIEAVGRIESKGNSSRKMSFEARKVTAPRPDLKDSAADYLAEPVLVSRASGTCVVPEVKQRTPC